MKVGSKQIDTTKLHHVECVGSDFVFQFDAGTSLIDWYTRNIKRQPWQLQAIQTQWLRLDWLVAWLSVGFDTPLQQCTCWCVCG